MRDVRSIGVALLQSEEVSMLIPHHVAIYVVEIIIHDIVE